MVTSSIIRRTFQIKIGAITATSFTIDVDGKQYLCTAKHCVPAAGSDNFQHVEIFHEKRWKRLNVKLVGFGSAGTDICVLAPEEKFSPSLPLIPTADGIVYSQDVYFLGFPYGLRFEVGINNGFPLPLVKRGIVSAILNEENGSDKQLILLLDGHNNIGFSGGPVVFRNDNNPKSDLQVAAVISGYGQEYAPVFAGREKDVISIEIGNGGRRQMRVPINTGIIISYSISHALDAINNNPIGLPINEQPS